MNRRRRVVVLGAGLAGLAAGVRAAELGMDVTVLEQGKGAHYPCNSRYAGGLFHIAMNDMGSDPDVIVDRLQTAIGSALHLDLAQALAANAGRTLKWLYRQGVRMIRGGPDGLRQNALAPPGMRQTGFTPQLWRGRSGDAMLSVLRSRLDEYGGMFRQGVRARELMVSAHRCGGIVAQLCDGKQVDFAADAVILADGGFQANPALMKRFVSQAPEKLLMRNAGTGIGSGLLMAEAVGASLTLTEQFYGHVQYGRALNDDRYWPYPVLDSVCGAGIVVDAEGKRFCDETRGGIYLANCLSQLSDPASAHVIFDHAIWETAGRAWILPPNPHLMRAGAALISAPDVADLARQINVDKANLQRSMAGAGMGTNPPRSRGRAFEGQPPYYAFPLCAGVTYTMGGIAIDDHARVLGRSGKPIEGLWAAGATTGGLEGGPSAGYSGGLSKASVFGLLAAESAFETTSYPIP